MSVLEPEWRRLADDDAESARNAPSSMRTCASMRHGRRGRRAEPESASTPACCGARCDGFDDEHRAGGRRGPGRVRERMAAKGHAVENARAAVTGWRRRSPPAPCSGRRRWTSCSPT